MPPSPRSPDLHKLVGTQLGALLGLVDVGAQLPIGPPCALCDVLELLVPQILRRKYEEWETESLDGFFFASAVKTDEESAELVGICILITDQTVTPIALDLTLLKGSLHSLRVRLGEAGRGSLGISGPDCNSPDARELLLALNARLDRIEWVYDATL